MASSTCTIDNSNSETQHGNKKRDEWSRPIEFILSCLAMSAGLGNIWRFPFVAYENGGGAFLLVYIVVLLLIGMPLYFLEMSLGQFASSGCVAVWNMAPAFRGIGYGQLLATTCVASYYVCLVARIFFYLVASMSSQLPWTKCDPAWKDVDCHELMHPKNTSIWLTNGTEASSNETFVNDTISSMDDSNLDLRRMASLPELYLRKTVLKSASNIDNGIGAPDWKLTLYLLFSWNIIFFTLVRGVKSSGKVAYFAALFPYVMLFAILAHSLTLEGAVDGLLRYVMPEWKKLLDPEVWYQAVVQCFFSLSVCFGSIIMFSSYNRFDHPINRDALIVSLADMMTSFIAGMAIFSICGSTAHALGTDVSSVIEGGGASLPFVLYPAALSTFKHVPQLFAFMFFLMQLTMGVGSAMGPVGCIVTVMCDRFPSWKRWLVTLVVCTCGFLIGLIYVTPGGDFMLVLVDHFGGGFVVFALAILEVVAISWVYGVTSLCDDIQLMTGRRPSVFHRFSWSLLIPATLLTLFLYSNIVRKPISYGGVLYPTAAVVCGWMLATVALSPLIVLFVLELYKHWHLGIIEALRTSLRPNSEWGPMRSKDRDLWQKFTGRTSSSSGQTQ